MKSVGYYKCCKLTWAECLWTASMSMDSVHSVQSRVYCRETLATSSLAGKSSDDLFQSYPKVTFQSAVKYDASNITIYRLHCWRCQTPRTLKWEVHTTRCTKEILFIMAKPFVKKRTCLASVCSFIEEQTTSALRVHPMARRQDFKFDPLCSAHLQTLRYLNADATTSLKEIQSHPIHHFRFKALFMTLKKFQTTASAELTTKCFHEHNC